MKEKYLAHISDDKTREQLLMDHLIGTAELAGQFAKAFDCEEQGRATAKSHDLGKATIAFEHRLLHDGPKVDHSTAGAKELYNIGGLSNILAAYCVAGHHAGLPDGGAPGEGAGTPTLHGRMAKELEDYSDFLKEIEIPKIPVPPLKSIGKKGGFSLAFYTRMLFSCLVDADYLDTEKFMSNGAVVRPKSDSMDVIFKLLAQHITPWHKNTDRNTINGRRTEILKACLEKGQAAQGLFQLTVPTGGGKTVSSMAFALRHAVEHDLERIVYVIPYTSIIEQNAQVFRDIFGDENVLEDHCNVTFDDPDELKKYQLAAENYDKRIIVTTNVQFFESLFSNMTSKCRKLHNLAKSVIIFDEAQMLPVEYLLPCIRAISELVYNYHCTAVLCTATQPALNEHFPKEVSTNIQEICPNVEEQYQFFKRTQVVKIGEISEEVLINSLKDQEQALCILGSRANVRRVFKQLQNEGVEGVYHLSTLMYPEHRKRILEEIRERLKSSKPCRVISTSLIEAGVDVDFPSVWRQLAGIDSIIQAAGRCNREGKRPLDQCKTVFFTLEGQKNTSSPSNMRRPISVAEQIVSKYEDISELQPIHEYFKNLYKVTGDGIDKKLIVDAFENAVNSCNFPFKTVSDAFQLIEQETKTVLIPIEPKAKEIAAKLEEGIYSKQLMRDAGRYCVSLYKNEYEALHDLGYIKEPLFEGFAVLTDKNQYKEEYGLEVVMETGIGIMFEG